MNKLRIGMLAIIGGIALVLSGCVKAEYHVTVNKDKSADVAITLGIEKQMASLMSSQNDPFASTEKEMKSSGFKVQKHNDNEYNGIMGTKHFNNLKDINVNSISGDKKEKNPFNIEVHKSFFTTIYIVKGNFNMNGTSMMANQMDLKFKLTLPMEPNGKNNATNVSGKTLTWNLNPTGSNKIELETKVINWGNIIGTIMVVLIVVAGMIFFIRKRKNA